MKHSDKNKQNRSKRSNDKSGDFSKASRPKQKQRFKKPKLESVAPTNPNPRLNKYLANAGIASRRASDTLIAAGNVTINDKVVVEMGYRVQPDDVVKFKGKVVEKNVRKVYILMNKPKNTITTTHDPEGRKTVMTILKNACDERIYPVGRLDRQTTGLLLFTNDGDLAKKLSHPSYNVKKIYHVVLDKKVSVHDIQKIGEGLELEDGYAEVDKVSYVQDKPKNEIGIEIHIGRNRIVRRIFQHLGYEVVKLDRVYYAGLTKKDIPRGMYRFLKPDEIRMMKYFV
jgi:23S rRNA pseudouridine2605 synthase